MKPRNTIQIIEQAVAKTLPAGEKFELIKDPIELHDSHILRVITPSRTWGKMDKMDRFSMMQDAILPKLTSEEKKKIFRISVLTPTEWQKIKKDRPGTEIIFHSPTKGSLRKTASPRPATSTRTLGRKKTTIVAGKKG